MNSRTLGTAILAALLLLALVGSSAFSQQWAEQMLNKTSHNFGTVARGTKVQYRFVVENIYEEDARILSVGSSCGCTTPKFSKKILKTWDKTEIVAVLDTRNFLGQKDATLTVVFDLPFPAKVQLHIHAYIRSDVVVQPGVVALGSVAEGTPAVQKVQINYAGRNDWKIERVESGNSKLKARVVETRRSEGQVDYELIVELADDAPVGYIRDQVVLVTNDQRATASRVPIAVEGVVVPAVKVRPSPLLLGIIRPGKTVTRRLVVQGQKPFAVVSATCEDKRFACPASETPKSLHLLPVTFTADETTGNVTGKILIETDLTDEPIEVSVHVRVMPEGVEAVP